jgi:hypothetical protein
MCSRALWRELQVVAARLVADLPAGASETMVNVVPPVIENGTVTETWPTRPPHKRSDGRGTRIEVPILAGEAVHARARARDTGAGPPP